MLDALLHKNINEVIKIAEAIGSQAVIASLPLEIINEETYHYNYLHKDSRRLNKEIINLVDNRIISEVMIIDRLKEGYEILFVNH